MSITYRLHPDLDESDWVQLFSSLPETLHSLPKSNRVLGGRNAIYKLPYAGRVLAIKCFENKGLWKKVAYRLNSSKAERSFLHSVAFQEAGFDTAQPIAWWERRRGSWLQESYYLSEFLDFEHDASALLREDCAERDFKLALLGRTLAGMHEAELWHLDINQGNWLFYRDAAEEWHVAIIDNNRLRRAKIDVRRGVACFAQLKLPDESTEVMLEAYAKRRGASVEECIACFRKSRRVFSLKRKIKNATRPWRRKIGL